mmetsp:Transcript_20153/g.17852  ORF Transcript_20153/g.17852 Transcript_20153/m.17852 type:complete len:195 (+) Transcript_20153:59-643(+)
MEEDIAIIHFDSKIDLFGTKDEITSLNYFRKIYQRLQESKFKTKVVFIGIQSIFCPSQILDDINELSEEVPTDLYWLRKDIRTIEEEETDNTQAGTVFSQALAKLNEEGFTNIEVSFDMSVLKAKEAPGRSDICTADGLTAKEAIDISTIAGNHSLVKSFIVSEFNPGIETTKTGKVLMSMFHNFINSASNNRS